jgi:PAS domain S-box-containing protein
MRINPLKIVLLYFLISLGWILLGGVVIDVLHSWLPFSKDKLEVIKGVVFISLTALLLYFAIRRQGEAADRLRKSEHEKLQQLYDTEKELNQSLKENQKLAEVIDRIHNMVVITDTYGRVSWVNQTFINFTGFRLEDIQGKTTDFLHGPETDQKLQLKIMSKLESSHYGVFEVLNYTSSGTKYWVEMTISGIYNEKNELIRYISIQNVITERKLSEAKLQQQNRILRKMSWTNSHAIRKPVASIISLVELSKQMTDPDELNAIHGLIGICAAELDEITREVSKMMSDSILKE